MILSEDEVRHKTCPIMSYRGGTNQWAFCYDNLKRLDAALAKLEAAHED